MRSHRLCKAPLTAFVLVVAMCAGVSLVPAQNQSNPGAETKSQACPNDDSGLKLPAGFCATVFADGIGHARHLAGGAERSGLRQHLVW